MSSDLYREAERILTICNACRYCEGFCAVFPAMERRRTFSQEDLLYLANLCHNCRDCYYACQYAPPHPFHLNFPETMARLRLAGYEECAWPSFARRFFGRKGAFYSAGCVASFAALFLFLGIVSGRDLWTAHLQEGFFFSVISYPLVVGLFGGLFVLAGVGLTKGVLNLWRKAGGPQGAWGSLSLHARALRDAATLRYLGGLGVGCNYPGDDFSMTRRYLHHAVFYGFGLCFAATSMAAFYEHFLDLRAPYPLGSWPVVLGTLGGLGILGGAGGLLWLKVKMDPDPAAAESTTHDLVFLGTLFLVALSGLLLLLLRNTPLMGGLLLVHLGLVAGFFAVMPWGKFVHGIYRYAALLRNAFEASREA